MRAIYWVCLALVGGAALVTSVLHGGTKIEAARLPGVIGRSEGAVEAPSWLPPRRGCAG